MTKKTNTREEIRKMLSKVYSAGGNEIKVIHEADIPELEALIEKEKKEARLELLNKIKDLDVPVIYREDNGIGLAISRNIILGLIELEKEE